LIPEFDYFDTLTQLNNVFHLFIFQIEEGDVFYVAGGLLVEHPLTSPLVEAIVGTIDSVMGLPKSLTEKLIKESLEEP
jgi:predicted house-cleaning NTP pyrophosphatase (Maf/HAM1 superfamily)